MTSLLVAVDVLEAPSLLSCYLPVTLCLTLSVPVGQATQEGLFKQWLSQLAPGQQVDACDCDGKWYEAQVRRLRVRVRVRVSLGAEVDGMAPGQEESVIRGSVTMFRRLGPKLGLRRRVWVRGRVMKAWLGPIRTCREMTGPPWG